MTDNDFENIEMLIERLVDAVAVNSRLGDDAPDDPSFSPEMKDTAMVLAQGAAGR